MAFAGSAREHLRKSGEHGARAASWARMAEDFAEKGECKRALTMLTSAHEENGRAHTHADFTDKLPRLTGRALARRRAIRVAAATGHHAAVHAETTFARVCLVRSR
jgi:hypothetical protein